MLLLILISLPGLRRVHAAVNLRNMLTNDEYIV